MAVDDRVMPTSFQIIYVKDGKRFLRLHIAPYTEAVVVEEAPTGDVSVIFLDYPFKEFVFKKDELIYVN